MSLDWLAGQKEGQFFERKSCYDRATGVPKRRNVRDVAYDVAETLSAMANADGGTLALGIENDGIETGVDYPDDRMQVILNAPSTHVNPPLRATTRTENRSGKNIVLFDVDWSADVHQLADGRYLLRVGDRNLPFPASDIEAIKEGRRRRATEMRPIPEASLNDIDLNLVAELAKRVSLPGTPEEVLLHYRLAERRDIRLVLTLVALLLFGKDPSRWHPRCGVDFVRYEGTERLLGAALNIVKRERLDAPLVRLIEEAYRTVQPHVRERQQLVDLFFEERLEYPPFAWQEAIVNAVAHRDYHYEGVSIEIWMFDDRLEIRSPGELVEPVTIERLQRRERIHASRNPRIVRVLTDAGYMREQGEGVPRMFEVMEHEGLYPPELRMEADTIFNLTLKNTPIYGLETMRWLAQFDPLGLSGNQKRILAYAREHENTFTSQTYQRLVHVDMYAASKDIKDLIRKNLVKLPQKRGRVYELALVPSATVAEKPGEYVALEPLLRKQGYISNRDLREILSVSQSAARRIAGRLVTLGWLDPVGEARGRRYLPRR